MAKRVKAEEPETVESMIDRLDSMSTEEMQAELARTQLKTALILQQRAEEDAYTFQQKREEISRRNKQRQANLAKERREKKNLITACNHKQGGGPDNMLEGDGKSALYRAEIFFPGNSVVFCLRCPLQVMKPHPDLRKTDRKAYDAALEEWQRLVKESKSNGLEPMKGPTYEFTNEEGATFVPALV